MLLGAKPERLQSLDVRPHGMLEQAVETGTHNTLDAVLCDVLRTSGATKRTHSRSECATFEAALRLLIHRERLPQVPGLENLGVVGALVGARVGAALEAQAALHLVQRFILVLLQPAFQVVAHGA